MFEVLIEKNGGDKMIETLIESFLSTVEFLRTTNIDSQTTLLDAVGIIATIVLLTEFQLRVRAAVRYKQNIVDRNGEPILTPRPEDHEDY